MAKAATGKEVTAALIEKLQARVAALKEKGVTPKLGILRCGENPSDLSYESGATKRAELIGVEVEKFVLPEDVTKEALIAKIEKLNKNDAIHGVLMFRPLPKHLKADQNEICNISSHKDVDCMTDLSNAGVFRASSWASPPAPPAPAWRSWTTTASTEGQERRRHRPHRCVIGKPVAMMLMARTPPSPSATPRPSTRRDHPPRGHLVSAAGVLGSLTKDYVRPGQIVIDVSMNWDAEKSPPRVKGAIAGDACSRGRAHRRRHHSRSGRRRRRHHFVLIGHVVEAAERKAK